MNIICSNAQEYSYDLKKYIDTAFSKIQTEPKKLMKNGHNLFSHAKT